jgi:hypothetical protein
MLHLLLTHICYRHLSRNVERLREIKFSAMYGFLYQASTCAVLLQLCSKPIPTQE